MTAEAFIKEKLIPWVEDSRWKYLDNADDADFYYQCAHTLKCVSEFIEQHRAEWESK